MLAQVALKAVVLGEYDDSFFNFMPKIFPYNRYTLSVTIPFTLVAPLLQFSVETHQASDLEGPYQHSHRTAK
jgi:hypothetical protein